MTETRKFQSVKGMRDILPPDSSLWSRVERVAREVFSTYDFSEIILPILEEDELFVRSVGLQTDIVQKEMFSFEDTPNYDLVGVVDNFGGGVDLDRPRDFEDYKENLREFIKQYRSLLDSGEIPQRSAGILRTLEARLLELMGASLEKAALKFNRPNGLGGGWKRITPALPRQSARAPRR